MLTPGMAEDLGQQLVPSHDLVYDADSPAPAPAKEEAPISDDEDCTSDDSISVHRPSEHEESETEYEEEEIPEMDWTLNINELPVEILCKILEISSDNSDNSVSFAFCASLVCSWWKAITFASPTLWGRIDAEKSPEVITTLLERSKKAPLDIWIYLNPMVVESQGVTRIGRFVALIAPQRWRFRSLTFHYYYPSWFEAGASLVTFEPIIPIDTLDVRRLQFYNPSMQLIDTTVHLDQMTLIPRRLRYDELHLPTSHTYVPMFSNSLISLDIRWSTVNAPTDTFVRMLSQAGNLEYLRLSGFKLPAGSTEDSFDATRYWLPSLREAMFESVSPESVRHMFHLMETPALEWLTLDLDLNISLDGSILSICKRNPQLQRLRLNSCLDIRSSRWKSIFSSLPALTHFYLSKSGAFSRQKALKCLLVDRTSPESALCPKLRSVTFDCAEHVGPEFITELVRSRMGVVGVSPIKYLKWKWISLCDAEEAWEALREFVNGAELELILEYADLDAFNIHPDWWDPVEEWISEGDDLDLDSGDEEVIAEGR